MLSACRCTAFEWQERSADGYRLAASRDRISAMNWISAKKNGKKGRCALRRPAFFAEERPVCFGNEKKKASTRHMLYRSVLTDFGGQERGSRRKSGEGTESIFRGSCVRILPVGPCVLKKQQKSQRVTVRPFLTFCGKCAILFVYGYFYRRCAPARGQYLHPGKNRVSTRNAGIPARVPRRRPLRSRRRGRQGEALSGSAGSV